MYICVCVCVCVRVERENCEKIIIYKYYSISTSLGWNQKSGADILYYIRIIYPRDGARCKNKGTCVLSKGFNAPYDAPVCTYITFNMHTRIYIIYIGRYI